MSSGFESSNQYLIQKNKHSKGNILHVYDVFFFLFSINNINIISFEKFTLQVFRSEIQNNEVDYINNRIETITQMVKTQKYKNKCVSVRFNLESPRFVCIINCFLNLRRSNLWFLYIILILSFRFQKTMATWRVLCW